jgi:hypothetical protein
VGKDMKTETKKKLKEFLGSFASELVPALLIILFGGTGIAYLFIGWGVLLLLLPFAALIYWALRK